MNSFQTLFDMIGELARRRYQMAEGCFSALGLNHTEARLLALGYSFEQATRARRRPVHTPALPGEAVERP